MRSPRRGAREGSCENLLKGLNARGSVSPTLDGFGIRGGVASANE
jgi:hypothetical protein